MQKALPGGRRRLQRALRRHLAGRHTVVKLDPERKVRRVLRSKSSFGQIQPTAECLLVVAGHAVLSDEALNHRRRACFSLLEIGLDQSGGEQQQDRSAQAWKDELKYPHSLASS